MASVQKGMILIRTVTRSAIRCPLHRNLPVAAAHGLHTSAVIRADHDDFRHLQKDKWTLPTRFTSYNDVIYPPTKEGEEIRPAEYCHVKKVAGSYKKFWYSAVMVRGLSIDEAIRQCEFSNKAFPKVIQEVLLEAQKKMLKECNVEFASNMFVADSYVTQAGHFRTVRRTRRGPKKVTHPLTNYFLRLREGPPPEHYYPPEKTGYEKLEDYIQSQRQRKIRNSL